MGDLVLSLFPGFGLLDHAFTVEGFNVVRGPDVIWGGDIRTFHPPPGVFDGIIGGDPCQSHSSMVHLLRATGKEPSFPDMTPEYKRVVELAQPAWFLRENVPKAPEIKPDGYDVRSFMLDNSTMGPTNGEGNEQMRRRRWWYGVRDGECPELRQWIDFALFESPDKTQVATQDSRSVPVVITSNGKRKSTADRQDVKRDLAEILRLQGFPTDWLDHQPWTMQAKRKMVGNGVALPMGRALARAVRKAKKARVE